MEQGLKGEGEANSTSSAALDASTVRPRKSVSMRGRRPRHFGHRRCACERNLFAARCVLNVTVAVCPPSPSAAAAVAVLVVVLAVAVGSVRVSEMQSLWTFSALPRSCLVVVDGMPLIRRVVMLGILLCGV